MSSDPGPTLNVIPKQEVSINDKKTFKKKSSSMVILKILQQQSQLYTISGITVGGQQFLPYSYENETQIPWGITRKIQLHCPRKALVRVLETLTVNKT